MGDEIARLDRAIADLKAQELALGGEFKKIASAMTAAAYQRDILAHEQSKRDKKAAPKPRMWNRRSERDSEAKLAMSKVPGPGNRLPRADQLDSGLIGGPPAPEQRAHEQLFQEQPPQEQPPREQSGPTAETERPRIAPLGPFPPRMEPPRRGFAAAAARDPLPEASPRSVQNLMLGLGSLLLGITAIVFAAIALSDLGAGTKLAVLGLATVGLLIAPSMLLARGLHATAESLAVVGLVLLPMDGYVLTHLEIFQSGGISERVLGGLIFGVSAIGAFLYHQATGLTSARWMVVLSTQPVLPLLAYDFVKGPAGWALVLSLVAAADAIMARALDLYPPKISPNAKANQWLRELTWVLHGLAIGAAGVYALTGLLRAGRAASGGEALAATARSALTLLIASLVGLMGAVMLRKRPLGEVAAGAVTLSIIISAAQVAMVALPGERALLVVSIVVTATGLAVRALPVASRKGPQFASALALAALGAFVIGSTVRAAIAPVLVSLPLFSADLTDFAGRVAGRADSPDWTLAATVALITTASALALPPAFRREAAVAGAALTALAAPASLHLTWVGTQLTLIGAAIGLLALGQGVVGGIVQTGQTGGERAPWAAATVRAARSHVAGAAVVGAAALAVALAHTWSTAGMLVVITVAGLALGFAPRLFEPPQASRVLTDTAEGAAAFAAPGAVGMGVVTLWPWVTPAVAIAAACIAASVTLALVAVRLVSHRRIGMPLAMGTGMGALAVTGAGFTAPGASVLDAGVGALLLVAAILLALAPSIDTGLRADRKVDGADVGAAAVTVAGVASLARVAELVAPALWLIAGAFVVLGVAVGVKSLPEAWRRGPSLGAGIAGGLLTIIAGYPALAGGVRAVTAPGEFWSADISPSAGPTTPFGWQAPLALVVLALAAATALPRPRSYDAAAVCVVLATIGTPAALGWPWWSSIVLGLLIATGYAMFAVVAPDGRAGYARLAVALAVALHALGSSLVRDWTTAAALGVIALVSVVMAGLSAVVTRMSTVDGAVPPAHLDFVGGAGLLGTIVFGSGALAAFVATSTRAPDPILTAALAGIAAAVAIMAIGRRLLGPYLGWGSIGVAAAATLVAVLALLSERPSGVYAAGGVLVVVLADLVRLDQAQPVPIPVLRTPRQLTGDRQVFSSRQVFEARGSMAAIGAAVPGLIAVASLFPALREALAGPYDRLDAIWQGPPPAVESAVNSGAVITALLLTIAGAIAAVGFGGGMTRAVSVVVPSVAITLLITPVSLGMAWPAEVMAALTVFTVCMLSVALTPPPSDYTDRGTRAARVAVLVIGLIAGGSGLVGSLATPGLTIFTFAGAVLVGLAAAFGGVQQSARITGWLGAALAAQLFVMTVSLRIGAKPEWAAFAVLAVGFGLVVCALLLPRFNQPSALPEASAIEWAGYSAGVIAVALAARSPVHVAALLVGFGAMLGISATRPGRIPSHRRILYWTAAGSEIVAWYLILRSASIALPEAYTIPFALIALAVGLLELRHHPTLGSWAAYGPALIAGFGPTVIVVLTTRTSLVREIGLLLVGILVLTWGSRRQQQAPVTVGATVTTVTALHALAIVSTYLAVGVGGITLIILGANSERRRRATDRLSQMN